MSRGDLAADLFLGVDGGGTRCSARLADRSGHALGEGTAGPANIRLGLEAAFASVMEAAGQCLAEAGLGDAAFARVSACLALAGATEPRWTSRMAEAFVAQNPDCAQPTRPAQTRLKSGSSRPTN